MKNFKFRSGEFHVYHVGPMQYSVEYRGSVVGSFKNYSSAVAYAMRAYDAAKAGA